MSVFVPRDNVKRAELREKLHETEAIYVIKMNIAELISNEKLITGLSLLVSSTSSDLKGRHVVCDFGTISASHRPQLFELYSPSVETTDSGVEPA